MMNPDFIFFLIFIFLSLSFFCQQRGVMGVQIAVLVLVVSFCLDSFNPLFSLLYGDK